MLCPRIDSTPRYAPGSSRRVWCVLAPPDEWRNVAGTRLLNKPLKGTAADVKSIVSADTFGHGADGNIGDMLQHRVGLRADYNRTDVRQVSIRGDSVALKSVTMDGPPIASSPSAGAGRQFEAPVDRAYAACPNRITNCRAFPTRIAGSITGRFEFPIGTFLSFSPWWPSGEVERWNRFCAATESAWSKHPIRHTAPT
jgi:hypothetical protein